MAEPEATQVTRAQVAGWWLDFARHECRGYSPLYEAICTEVADAPDVLDLVLGAPRFGRQPNVLLAAVHDLVLRSTTHPLGETYEAAGRGEAIDLPAAGRTFCDLVRRERVEIARLLSFRRTNTNECGRSAVLVPALRWAGAHVGEPIALLDVGTSAGLNLHLDRYRIDYGGGRMIGPVDATVVIGCDVTGDPPIDGTGPALLARVGLDRAPVDLDDEAEVRWLLACVWPDTGRLPRTRAAIDVARAEPVEIVRGDAVDDLAATMARLPPDVPVAVTTTWVLAYLRPPERASFVEELAAASRRRPVVWISAEGPGVAPGLPMPAFHAAAPDMVTFSVLGGAIFRDGALERAVALGRCHPHGRVLHWAPTDEGAEPT